MNMYIFQFGFYVQKTKNDASSSLKVSLQRVRSKKLCAIILDICMLQESNSGSCLFDEIPHITKSESVVVLHFERDADGQR